MELVYPILCQVITNGELASLKQQDYWTVLFYDEKFTHREISYEFVTSTRCNRINYSDKTKMENSSAK